MRKLNNLSYGSNLGYALYQRLHVSGLKLSKLVTVYAANERDASRSLPEKKKLKSIRGSVIYFENVQETHEREESRVRYWR